ncbi:HdeD family acid-resistance protein [Xanthomonas massiliensis]|jgi:uncharacterized membrane protein HdeD (DUF308 family)|uniref:HdeD family acid-resistance protein n=1 Tax=Xanthomonas massiliensis TaxID=1720302 RepID=UPI0008262881|nr:DUF308 domain-containing protein [Xanthomonas massiliensis]
MSTGLLASVGRSWWVLVVYGVISVIFGVIAIVQPFQAGVALAWAFGIMALVEGVISVVALFSRDAGVSKGWLALYALASIVFGVLAVLYPVATAGALLLLLAAWLVVAGIFRIVFAIRVRREIQGEWLIALSGVLAIVLGVLIAVFPIAGLLTMMIWIGVGALVYGVLQIVGGFKVRKLFKPV